MSESRRGKSQVTPLFNRWLDLMEEAHRELSVAEFAQLEDKIINEIRSSRRSVQRARQTA